jgi:hypothetical protein
MIDVDLPEELVQFGVVLGLLKLERPGDPGSVVLDTAFFADPAGTLAGLVHDADRLAAALDLAAALFGEAERTLDLPTLPQGQSWVPLARDGSAGLFAVVDVADDRVDFGVAGRAATGVDGLQVSATVALPVARSHRTAGISLLPGTADGAVRIGVAVELPPTDPGDAVALDGVAFTADLPTAPGQEPQLAVRLQGLRLPAWPEPRELVLTDDPDAALSQLVSLLHGLLEGRAGLGDEASARVGAVLALLGLGDRPGIPPLPLADLFDRGAAALVDWLRALIAPAQPGEPLPLRVWLEALAELLGLDLPAGVTGGGSAADPLRFCAESADGVELCVTVVVEEAGGAVTIRPGVAASLRIGMATLPGRLRAEAELAAVTLAATPSVAWLPRLEAGVELARDGAPLVRIPAAGAPADLEVGTFRAGVAAGVDHRARLVIEAVGVVVGGTSHPRLDLSSVDAVGQAAGTVASDALAGALDDFLGPGRGRALTILLGFTRPVPDADPWPALAPVAELFSDPLGSWGRYHARVLAAGGWGRMAAELALLAGVVPPAVQPAGTTDDPWVLPVPGPNNVGDLEVHLWRTGLDTLPRLHVAAALVANPVDLDDATLRLSGFFELATIDLPAAAPAAPVLSFADAAEIRLRVGDDLVLPAGPVTIAAGAVTAIVGWRKGRGWEGAARIDGATVTSGDETIALADPLELTTAAPAAGSSQWRGLERLLGRGAASSGNPARAVAAGLVGWLPSLRLPLVDDAGVDLVDFLDDWPTLRLKDLVTDPAAALGSWFAALLAAEGPDLAYVGAGFATALLAGRVGESVVLPPDGAGTPDDPWSAPIGGDPAAPALVAWLDPEGPGLQQLDAVLRGLTPPDLMDALNGAGPLPEEPRLAEILRTAGRFDPALRAVLAGRREWAGVFTELHDRLGDSDGLLVVDDDPAAAAPTAVVEGAAHLTAPALFDPAGHAPGVDPARIVYVAAALPGVSPWPGQPAGSGADTRTVLLDLSAPGLPPEAVRPEDLATNGPWYVLLPTRAAAGGADAVTDRLRAAVQAVHVASPGPITLVAHSVAGFPARAVWSAGHAERLVTLATPGTVPIPQNVAAEAVRLLRQLTAWLPGTPAPGTDLRRLVDLLRTRAALAGEALPGADGVPTARPFPLADFTPPPQPVDPAGAAAPVILTARISEEQLRRGTAAAIRATTDRIRATLPELTAGRARAPATHLGLGIAAGWPEPPAPGVDPGGLRGRVDVRLDAYRIRLRGPDVAPTTPRLSVAAALWRDDGWLVGDAAAGADPRLRRVEVRLEVDLVTGATTARVVLQDAGFLGIDLGRLELGAPGSFDGVAREVLGHLAAALASLPAGGPARDVLEALSGLGVVTIDAGGTVGFVAEALERLLADPAGYLVTRGSDPAARERLTAAIGRLLGAAPGGPLQRTLGAEVVVSVDAAERSVTLTAGGQGVALGGLVRLRGGVTVGPAARTRVQVRLGVAAGPGSATAVVTVDSSSSPTVSAGLEIDAGGTAPIVVPILPVADPAQLGERLMTLLTGEVARAALQWAREHAAVDPLLDAIGLLAPGPPPVVRNPAWLLRDPGTWLIGPAALGDPARPGMLAPAKLARVLSAAAQLLGGPATPGAGEPLALPGGGELSAVEDGTGLAVTVRLRSPDVAGFGGDVAFVLRVLPGPVVRTEFTAKVRKAGTAGFRSVRAELTAGETTSLVVRLAPLDPAATELVLPLLPQTPGLAALTELAATGAVEHALPALLEALTGAGAGDPRIANLASALRLLGDALRIRDPASGTFRIAELRQLAADPPAELAARFRARPADTIAAVRALVAAVTGTAPATGPLWQSAGGKVAAELGATATGALQLRVAATGLVPAEGFAAGIAATVSDAGLGAATLTFDVTDANALLPGPVDLLPFARVTLGAEVPERVEVGMWLDPPGAATREALLVQVTLGVGTVVLHRRVTATGTTDGADLTAAIPALVKRLAVPLAAELALMQSAVEDLLETFIGTRPLGEVLADAQVLAGPPWRLADGLLDQLVSRALRAVAELVQAAGGPALGPFRITLRTQTGAPVPVDWIRYGLSVRLADPLEPPAIGGILLAVEGDDVWDPPIPGPPGDHLELWIVELPKDPLATGLAVRATPGVRVRGLGLRVHAEQGPLLDTMLRIDSLAIHGAFAQDADGFGYAGARVVVEGLGIDLASAGGGNPVAGKVLSPGPGGDPEPVRPSFSPELRLFKQGAAPIAVTVRAGLGKGPWWIPIQRSFGPVYIAQIGLDVAMAGGEPSEVSLLLDGGASLAGLAVGVDDLELIVPWATAGNPLTWRVDLAGLAIAFDNGSVTLAGGLRKLERDSGVEYLGMLVLRAAGFGLDVIGSWGEFPVPGSSGRYTSLFIFGALSATLGGPPAFFVTGIGAGVGINRGLVVPDDMTAVTRFPLVAAMSPDSTLAADPMAALDEIAKAFPPARGAFWLAAGVRFTTFTIVESVVVLTVAVGDGVEVTILGTSRLGLPNPAVPLVMIELAIRARFSSREGVLSVQAQLTERSWLLNPSCRLTGGFAFVIWFRTGEVLLTLGGYHPHFDRPARFPLVPRLGLRWQVSALVVVKGESYFALTPTAVMAGMRIEVGFDGGFVAATFTAGVDAIVSWDPAWYDVTVYIGVSARLQIEIDLWFFGTIRIWLGFSLGAELHVWGPRLRGEAIVDLGLAKVVVPFGASEPPSGSEPLGWAAFHDKYLVCGDASGETMELTVRSGQHLPDPGGPGGPPDDGTAARPHRLQPEFTLATATRTAANRVNGQALAGLPLDLVPMKVERVTSSHVVRVLDRATGAEVPAARRPQVTPVTGSVPDGIWRLPEPGDMGADGVHPAFTGALLIAVPAATTDVETGTVDDVQTGPSRPLPLLDDRDPASTLSAAMAAAAAWAAATRPEDTLALSAEALARAAFPRLAEAALARCVGARTARNAAAGPSAYALLTLTADRAAPPQAARITTGVVAPVSPAVTVRPATPPVPPVFPRSGPPKLAAVLWPQPAHRPAGVGRTTVGAWGRRYPRRTPPTLEEARAGRPPLAAHLHLVPPPLGAAGTTLQTRDPTTRFSRAGSGREWRRELLADRGPLEELEAAFGTGVTLPAGQVQVWHVPRAGADVAAKRPSLEISGAQAVRVVALGRTGAALLDTVVAHGTVTVPEGTQRLVAIGTGVPPASTAGTPGLAGWHAGAAVLRVHASACVLPGGLLLADAPPPLRNRTAVDAALVPGGEAVAGTGVTRTQLPADTRCVLVVLDVPAGGAVPGDGLLLGLDGAKQPQDATGAPVPPVAVVAGSRASLYFDIVPDGSGPVAITVARERGWVLAGVLGAARPATPVAREVGRHGVDALLGGLIERGPHASTLRWIGGTP